MQEPPQKLPSTQSGTDGALSIEQPLLVQGADAIAWAEHCDVLVAGFGAAGAAAAIAAREAGAQVKLVDRFEGGGATGKSGGIVYAGGGTPHQVAAGYQDTPEAMFEYLRLECGDAVSEPTLRKFCEDSRGLLAWLESIGASFDPGEPRPEPVKTSYPRDGVFLYYSGNESISGYAEAAKPAPRGHRVKAKGQSGRKLFELLRGRVEALGIAVQKHSAVRRLVVDSNTGAVLGAEVWKLKVGSAEAREQMRLFRRAELWHNFATERADRLRQRIVALELAHMKPTLVRARRGVMLTTGGFIFNREMLTRHAPKYLENLRLGTTACDGSGIRLGISAGGAPARLDKVSAWRFINPPTPWVRGLVVNARGERFCNEQSYGARLGVAMCEHHNGKAWLVLDARQRRAAVRECFFGGLWAFQKKPALVLMLGAPRGRTPEELAHKMGFDAAAFRATIDAANAAAHGQGADPQGKTGSGVQALEQPPYYAFDISAASRTFPCPAITLGGLRVDESSGLVLDGNGRAITGLYAAGRAAIGVASNGYVSGLSIADCLWSGRRAGAHAAAAGSRGTAVLAPSHEDAKIGV
jgi:3-oxo-5alpha-steroid 4-dehydrogenase